MNCHLHDIPPRDFPASLSNLEIYDVPSNLSVMPRVVTEGLLSTDLRFPSPSTGPALPALVLVSFVI